MGKRKESMGEKLQRLRDAAGLSQAALARAVGVPVTTLRNWEQDRRMPRLDTAAVLARELGVSLDQLAAGLTDAGPYRRPGSDGRAER